MMPGSVERHGPVPGYRPEGSVRNGLPETLGRGYRFRGMPDWNPAEGVHLDPSVAREEPRRPPEAASRSRAAKFAEFCEARDAGMDVAEASEYAGIARTTGLKYECARRAARAAAGTGGGS